jgi:FAD/FMN-containing dehydrogenase
MTAVTSEAQAAIDDLRATLRGRVLQPGDPGYDQARAIWNGTINRRPALIVQCAGVADVIAAVHVAHRYDMVVSVRGGGHNVAGNAVCDGGLMIDLSPMRAVHVDPVAGTVRAEPGVLLGELDHETQQFGYVVPAGIVSHTGLAGLTLGGGFGWLSRKCGLTIDHLLSVDVVTAEGRLLHASTTNNADLFWGIRGGGGNFGIVTSFEFSVERLGPEVLAGFVYFPAEEAHDVLRRCRDYADQAPEEVTTVVSLRWAPAAPFLPEHVHGKKVVAVGACYAGDPEEGEPIVAPLRHLGTPLADVLQRKPFVIHQKTLDPTVPHFNRYYWKSHSLPPLSDGAIDTTIEFAWQAPSPLSYTVVFQLGGAVSRVDEMDTAYGDRNAAHVININSNWTDQDADPENIAWAREYFDAMTPFSTGGVYVNFLGTEGEERIRAAYGPQKYERLAALKRKYDPTNFFRFNQNIMPNT